MEYFHHNDKQSNKANNNTIISKSVDETLYNKMPNDFNDDTITCIDGTNELTLASTIDNSNIRVSFSQSPVIIITHDQKSFGDNYISYNIHLKNYINDTMRIGNLGSIKQLVCKSVFQKVALNERIRIYCNQWIRYLSYEW